MTILPALVSSHIAFFCEVSAVSISAFHFLGIVGDGEEQELHVYNKYTFYLMYAL